MKRIEIDKEEFYDLFINKQLPIKDMALHFGVSTPVIERVRKELNLKRPRIYSMTMSLERFVEKCKNRYKDLYDYSKVVFNKLTDKIIVYCNHCEKDFEISANKFYQGYRECPYCSKEKIHKNRKTREQFIKEVTKIHGNKYNFDAFEYKGSKIKSKVWCNTCKRFFETTPSHLLMGRGCNVCGRKAAASKLKGSLEKFIEKAKKVHGDKYDYSKSVYPNNKEEQIFIHCNKCNTDFWQQVGNHLMGFGCPNCTRSKKEEFIYRYLIEHDISFISEYRFKDCKDKKRLSFDFYLPDYNICIEFQGKQHYEPWVFNKKKATEMSMKEAELRLEKQRTHDQIKRDYCLTNGIKLIEIRYDEDIKKRLEMELFCKKDS